jgi:site-specific DNA-adenine methylase
VKYIEPYLDAEMMERIDTIVEPFCGSCAFSLDYYIKKGYDKINYVVNDIDNDLINFFIYIYGHGFKTVYDYIKDFHFENTDKEIRTNAIRRYFDNGKNPLDYFIMKRVDERFYVKDRIHNFIEKYKDDKYKKTDEFFKNATITCKDYKKVFNEYKDRKDCLLFLDPPYMDSCNEEYKEFNKKYNKREFGRECEDSTQMYIDMVNLMKTAKCKVIGITNDNAMMRYLFNGWVKTSYNKTYQITKKKTKHILFMNF